MPNPWSQTDYYTLLGFSKARNGTFESFLYDEPTDDVTQGSPCININNASTTGDGTTTEFQLARALGPGGIDFIYDVNSSLVGLPTSGVNAITVGAGGGGYSYCAVVFSGGGGSGAQAYAVITGGAVASIVMVSAGVGYTSSPSVTFAGDGTGAAATAHMAPRIYLAGALQGGGYTIGAPGFNGGLLTFASAPGSGVAVTADFSWLWRVRFESDSLQFSNDASGFFSCKSCKLYQTRT